MDGYVIKTTTIIKSLTEKGKVAVKALAEQHQLSTGAVRALLQAVVNGGGTMAQFNIPELGGSGQWMKGGMTMVGDMFNHNLKGKVDQLCNELSLLLASEDKLFESDPKSASDFRIAADWWPADLGVPATSGAQNNFRYAYFPSTNRLIVDNMGDITIYDTLDHQISGVSQQQGSGSTVKFTSQKGVVDPATLPVISESATATEAPTPKPKESSFSSEYSPNTDKGEDIIDSIERLAKLFEKGILTQEEFDKKKKELLNRL